MKIEKNVPFGISDISKAGIMIKTLPKMDIGDSFLFDCADSYESSLWRAAINYACKKLKLNIKIKIKKQNEKEYRAWRIE